MSGRDQEVNYPSYTAQENAKNLDIATGVFGGLSGVSGVFAGYKKYKHNRAQVQVAEGAFGVLEPVEIGMLHYQMISALRMTVGLAGISVVLSAAKDAVLVPPNAHSSRRGQAATGVIGKVMLAAGPNIISIGAYDQFGVLRNTTAMALGITVTVAGLALIGVSQDVGNVVDWGDESNRALVFH